MNLYEIDNAILDLIDPETGEVMDYDAFEALQMEREQKIDNMALWIKDLDAEQAALDTEAKKLTERRDAARRKRDRLKEYLARVLDGEKRSTPQYAVSYRNSEACELYDEGAAIMWLVAHGYDDGYVIVKESVSKSAVKELLKRGEEVSGAVLVKRQSMSIK